MAVDDNILTDGNPHRGTVTPPPASVADPDPFDMDPNPAFHFNTDPNLALQFDPDLGPTVFNTDPNPYRFKEVKYLKQYFLYILT